MAGLNELVGRLVPPCPGSCPVVRTQRLWQGEGVVYFPAEEHSASPVSDVSCWKWLTQHLVQPLCINPPLASLADVVSKKGIGREMSRTMQVLRKLCLPLGFLPFSPPLITQKAAKTYVAVFVAFGLEIAAKSNTFFLLFLALRTILRHHSRMHCSGKIMLTSACQQGSTSVFLHAINNKF